MEPTKDNLQADGSTDQSVSIHVNVSSSEPTSTGSDSNVPTTEVTPANPVTEQADIAAGQPVVSAAPGVPAATDPAPAVTPNEPMVAPVIGSVGTVGTGPTGRRKALKWIVAAVAAVVVLAGGGGAYAYWQKTTNSPQAIFNAALKNGLQTKSFAVNYDQDGAKLALVSDIKDPKKLIVSGKLTADLSLFGDMDFKFYSDSSVTRMNFNKFLGVEKSEAGAAVMHKWVDMNPDAVNSDMSITEMAEFNSQAFIQLGQYIVGNFKPSQQATLFALLKDQQVYRYDAAKVSDTTIGGHTAVCYDVTLNTAALKKVNQKAAAMLGVDNKTELDKLQADIQDLDSARICVDKSSRRIVQVKIKQDDISVQISYSQYNTASPGSAPKQELTYSAFEAVLNKVPTGEELSDMTTSQPDNVITNNASPDDIERRNDIAFLESDLGMRWADNYGFYPTFAQLNDAAWRQVNMPDLRDETLADPVGKSPVLVSKPQKNAYAYEGTNCTEAGCKGYVITAILADGSRYVRSDVDSAITFE